MVEWSAALRDARDFLTRVEVPEALRRASGLLLDDLESFALGGSLTDLERGWGALESLQPQWQHWAAVAARRGHPWPTPAQASSLQVLRQFGRHTMVWRCPNCNWELGWSVALEPWEQACWPGEFSCPCCSASNDDPNLDESLRNECEP